MTSSISRLGSQYVIGLKAVNCDSGDLLAEAQQQTAGKEGIFFQGSGHRSGQLARQVGRVAQLGAEVRHLGGGSDHTIT